MKLSILALDKTLYQDDAQSVSVPGIEGQLQALDHHVPLITALSKGNIRVVSRKGAEEFEIEGGVLEVRPEGINILVIN